MKALAIDSAASCITIAAKNEDKTASVTLDIGMHQSEKLVPTIAYCLDQCTLATKDIDFTTLCSGPGSFTGLRLGFAALKALELANGCPIYGIPTLDVYAYPYKTWKGIVLSVIDAKKDRFYVSAYKKGELIKGPLDALPEEIIPIIKDSSVLAVGPDDIYFSKVMKDLYPELDITVFNCGLPCAHLATDALFDIAGKQFAEGKKGLAEYEGPIYIRKSEAEIVAEQKKPAKQITNRMSQL